MQTLPGSSRPQLVTFFRSNAAVGRGCSWGARDAVEVRAVRRVRAAGQPRGRGRFARRDGPAMPRGRVDPARPGWKSWSARGTKARDSLWTTSKRFVKEKTPRRAPVLPPSLGLAACVSAGQGRAQLATVASTHAEHPGRHHGGRDRCLVVKTLGDESRKLRTVRDAPPT